MILLSTWDDCHETPPMTSSAASGGCCEKTCQDTWSLQRTKLHIVQWRLEESGYNDRLCHGSHSCRTKLSQNISYWNMLMFSALHKKAFCHEGLCAHLFWLDNSTDRLVASVSWIYQLKSQWSACPFSAKIQWENKLLQHNEKLVILIGARHMLSVTETWVMTWIVAGEHPSQEVCTLNAPSSIFAEGFPTFVLRWNTSIVSFRSSSLSSFLDRRREGLLACCGSPRTWTDDAISRAVRRYFRSSSWNLAQILFSGYH